MSGEKSEQSFIFTFLNFVILAEGSLCGGLHKFSCENKNKSRDDSFGSRRAFYQERWMQYRFLFAPGLRARAQLV